VTIIGDAGALCPWWGGECVAGEVGQVDLAVKPALAEHSEHVLAAAAVQVVAVEPGELGDPQAEGQQRHHGDGAAGVEGGERGAAR
jgi:hypothetical protein